MEKRPNNNLINEIEAEEKFDGRIFRIMLGIIGIVSVVIAIMMMIAGAIGLWALINWTLSLIA